MFQGSAQHRGYNGASGPSSAKVAWSYAADDGHRTAGSGPIIGADGTVYIVRADYPFMPPTKGTVIDALRPDGTRRWQWQDSGEGVADTTPAVDSDGNVYVTSGSTYGHLVAIDSHGKTKWKVGDATSLIFNGTPTVGDDAIIYVQDVYSSVYALRASDGSQIWRTPISSPAGNGRGGTTLSQDGKTLYVMGTGELYALAAGDGHVQWRAATTAPTSGYCTDPSTWSVGTASVGPDGTIFVGTGGLTGAGDCGGAVDAFKPDGNLKWESASSATVTTTPAVGSGGLVVVGDYAGRLVALNGSDGRIAWAFQVPPRSESVAFYASPVMGADGTVYAPNGIQTESYFPEPLFAVRDGHLLWEAQGASKASPALTPGGVLYVAGSGGLIAFG
jgi:outer membrane protein assembly factor BamB